MPLPAHACPLLVHACRYGEWDSWKDFMDHSESDYVAEWMQWLRDHKVRADGVMAARAER